MKFSIVCDVTAGLVGNLRRSCSYQSKSSLAKRASVRERGITSRDEILRSASATMKSLAVGRPGAPVRKRSMACSIRGACNCGIAVAVGGGTAGATGAVGQSASTSSRWTTMSTYSKTDWVFASFRVIARLLSQSQVSKQKGVFWEWLIRRDYRLIFFWRLLARHGNMLVSFGAELQAAVFSCRPDIDLCSFRCWRGFEHVMIDLAQQHPFGARRYNHNPRSGTT